MTNRLSFLFGLVFLFSMSAKSGFCVDGGDLRYYSTRHSIGIEWDVTNDSDHDATCTVLYRQSETSTWKAAQDLFRVDFKSSNMMAGSIFYLTPGESYEVSLQLADPDGGGSTASFTLSTLSIPLPLSGRTLYVIPGSGGGSGTVSDPFRGIDAAQSAVQPGDTVLLGGGTYGGESEFTVSGQPDNYIVWKGYGDDKAIVETIRVSADHIWFENLDVQGNQYGVRTYSDPKDVVFSKNRFTGCHYCIYLNHGGSAWYIADNTIVGDVDPASGDFGGEGVELNHSDDHTVIYNTISRVADGVSYPGKNCDISGNEIFDVSDDGIEIDYGYANNRVYGNRISNAYHNGISFQPMNGAPWYLFRNQVAAPVESALKFRDAVDRALIVHNTFVGWQGVQKSGSNYLLSVKTRNNLWISMTDFYVWENGSGGLPNYRTDLDYDGFDWGGYIYGFKWGSRYADIAAFSLATGLEAHAIRVDKDTCFTSIAIPSSPPDSMPMQNLTLKSDCNAVDKGVILANINEDYKGLAPDLGAYENGADLPHYGARVEQAPSPPGTVIISPLLPLLFEE